MLTSQEWGENPIDLQFNKVASRNIKSTQSICINYVYYQTKILVFPFSITI